MPKGRGVMQDWSEEEMQAMRTLHAEGKSATEIAAALGTGRSRNSVLGKMHRCPDLFPARGPGVKVTKGGWPKGKRNTNHAWPEDITAKACEMWAEGATCAQIGEAIGKSEGAVNIKVVNNRGLFPYRQKQTVTGAQAKAAPVTRLAPQPSLAERFDPPPAAPEMKPVTLMDRRANQCCFPLWDHYGDKPTSESLYCGGDVHGDTPYCRFHRRLMRRSPTETEKRDVRRAA